MAKQIKTKITDDMVIKSYEIGKLFYNNQISLKDGLGRLEAMEMNSSSAVGYIYSYSNLIQGKLFTRTTNSFATEYYLGRIYADSGKSGLEKALLSLSQHIDYYEEQSGSSVNKRRKIYDEYLKLAGISFNEATYPDEVEKNQTYTEGQTKQVLVNIYERNSVARQVCINHYGAVCQVCGFDFEDTFGNIGKGFIHVHHVVDLASIGEEYAVNPIKDLVPVCPNCHAMLHRQKPAYGVEKMKAILKEKAISKTGA